MKTLTEELQERATEELARAIYNQFTCTEPGGKPKWVHRGNSLMQDKARDMARKLNTDTLVADLVQTVLERVEEVRPEDKTNYFRSMTHEAHAKGYNQALSDYSKAINNLRDLSMTTVEEMREAEQVRKNDELAEKARLKEKVLCAEITFPSSMQRDLGIQGFTMKHSEVADFIENEIENRDGNTVTFTIRYSMRTNKWIESLPEADI